MPPSDERVLKPSDSADSVTFSHAQDQCFLRFEVEDTGIGISEDSMKTLFNPFKQTQRLAGGTGLGLYSLAKRIEALKGSYGVSHRRDRRQGTLFWFTIPYRPDTSEVKMATDDPSYLSDVALSSGSDQHQTVMIQAQNAAKDATELPGRNDYIREGSAELTKSMKLKRTFSILIADDSATVLKMTSAMLRKHGYEISTAENGAIAVNVIKNKFQEVQSQSHDDEHNHDRDNFDVVLMDLQMPVMDGLEAVKRIRSMEKNLGRESSSPRGQRSLKIIGVSANSDHETMEEAFKAGIDAFLPKPFNINSFEKTLTQLL